MTIIASDYDGTLNHGGIDDAKREAISRWRRAGNLFGLVSGRGRHELVPLAVDNNIECDFVIADNGAVVLRPDGTVLCETRIDGSLAVPILKEIFSLSSTVGLLNAVPHFVVKAEGTELLPGECRIDELPEVPWFNQIGTFLRDFDEARRVTEIIRERFGKFVNPMQNGYCINIVPAGVNKARGIYGLLTAIGASCDDVITVGDNINDADMLEEFRSYAMANGVPAIKEIANEVTESVTEMIYRELERQN